MSENKKMPVEMELSTDDEEIDITPYISVRMEGDPIFDIEDEDDFVCFEDDDFDLISIDSGNELGVHQTEPAQLSPFSASRRKQALMARQFYDDREVKNEEEENQPSYSVDPKLWNCAGYKRRDELPLYLLNPADYDHDPVKQVRIRRAIATYRHHYEKKLQVIALTKENQELRKQLEKVKVLAVQMQSCGCDKNRSADLTLLDEEIPVVPPRTYCRGQRLCLASPYNEPWNTASLFEKPEMQQETSPIAQTVAPTLKQSVQKMNIPTITLEEKPSQPPRVITKPITMDEKPSQLPRMITKPITMDEKPSQLPRVTTKPITMDEKPSQLPRVTANHTFNQPNLKLLQISDPIYKIVKGVDASGRPQTSLVKITYQPQNTTQSPAASKFMHVQKLDTPDIPLSTIEPILKTISTNSPSTTLTASQIVLESRKMCNQPSVIRPVSSTNFMTSPEPQQKKQMRHTQDYFTPTSGATPFDKKILWQKIKQEEEAEDSEIEMAIQLDIPKSVTFPSTPPEVRRSRKQTIGNRNSGVKVQSNEFRTPIPVKVRRMGDEDSDKDFPNKYEDIIFETLADKKGRVRSTI